MAEDTRYIAGLQEAHRLVRQRHDMLMDEYASAPRNFIGGLTARHREITRASSELRELGFEIVNATIRKAIEDGKEI